MAENHYSATEHEALAVVDGIKRYRLYLFGAKFVIHTDDSSLSWLKNVKDPTGRLARWALQLQQYDFEILHSPGSVNGNADALSHRMYLNESMEPSAVPVSSVTTASTVPCSLPVTPIADCVPSVQHLHLL